MNNEATKTLQLGQNIAKIRKAKGLTQNALANLLDISREHVAKIETGKKHISLKLLFLLCEKLEINEKDLF